MHEKPCNLDLVIVEQVVTTALDGRFYGFLGLALDALEALVAGLQLPRVVSDGRVTVHDGEQFVADVQLRREYTNISIKEAVDSCI